MDDCIFCKIGRGEIEVNKVYEDKHVVAFLDKEPIREGHTLVIPKKHAAYVKDMSQDSYSNMMLAVQHIMRTLHKVFSPPKVGMAVSGWDIPHAHVHVVPMFDSKDITSKPILDKTAPQFTQEDFKNTQLKITRAL